MSLTFYIPSPHHAVAHLSLGERLSLPALHNISNWTKMGEPTSPLPWGEEQGEGVRFQISQHILAAHRRSLCLN